MRCRIQLNNTCLLSKFAFDTGCDRNEDNQEVHTPVNSVHHSTLVITTTRSTYIEKASYSVPTASQLPKSWSRATKSGVSTVPSCLILIATFPSLWKFRIRWQKKQISSFARDRVYGIDVKLLTVTVKPPFNAVLLE
jgi:hypothetical protein